MWLSIRVGGVAYIISLGLRLVLVLAPDNYYPIASLC